jgi:hypothetical protein
LGWIHNGVVSTTNNRTRRFSISPLLGGGWRNEESTWISKEALGDSYDYDKAYLAGRFSLQAVVGLAYEATEHVILGSEFALNAMSGHIKVFQQGTQVQECYYGASGLSVFVVLK